MAMPIAFLLLYLVSTSIADTNITENDISAINHFQDYALYRMKWQLKKADDGNQNNDDTSQMLLLMQHVIRKYLMECNVVFLTHSSFRFQTERFSFKFEELLLSLDLPVAHGTVTKNNKAGKNLLQLPGSHCTGYVLFVQDVAQTDQITGSQSLSKVVVVTPSSRWKVREYIEGPRASKIVNLLVIATSGPSDIVIKRGEKIRGNKFFNMYTHELYTDGIGSSQLRLLTSWRSGELARNVTLFPEKFTEGFNGRQFQVVASSQPPYVIKKRIDLHEGADESVLWDGIEIRLLHLLAPFLNFTMEIKEAPPTTHMSGSAEVVSDIVGRELADIATAGVHRPVNTSDLLSYSVPHTVDCAAFVTRKSTALPRYRAILGPFHWHVWLALIITYLLAIFPLTFADKHSFQVLFDNPWHFETMFWYVFGTFTNLFTFKGHQSWANSKKHAPRMFIGWYWMFSIIVTACYTGSIISFITLFEFPPGIDTVDQLLEENYRVGTLSTGDWSTKFNNSDHAKTKWLLRDIDMVPSIFEGLRNVSESFYLPFIRPYTLLASRAELHYAIKTNFTLKNRKDMLYVGKDCFAAFGVSIVYPAKAPYVQKVNEYILRAQQSGLIELIFRQMNWDMLRSSTGQRLQAGGGKSLREANLQDKNLTIDDTQGMFLLLGAGYLIAVAAFLSEISRRHGTRINMRNMPLKWRQIITDLQRTISNKITKPEIIVTPSNESFIYKTYDSRVLNSQHHNSLPEKFLFEKQITHQWYNLEASEGRKAKSLPAIFTVPVNLRKSSSCHELRSHRCSGRSCSENEFSASFFLNGKFMRFGSVGSVLPVSLCQDLMYLKFMDDRPQTSQI